MSTSIKSKASFLLLGFFVASIIQCSSDPDLGESPGVCSISCSGAKIPSNDMRVRFLFPEGTTKAGPFSLSCFDTVDGDYPNKVPIRFVIEKPRRTLPAEAQSDAVLGGEAPNPADAENPGDAEQWVPISGISFQPLLVAGIMEATDEANPSIDRYKGIVTPNSEWCTDTCGVGTIDIQPRCMSPDSTNKVSVGVIAGSLYGQFDVDIIQPFEG